MPELPINPSEPHFSRKELCTMTDRGNSLLFSGDSSHRGPDAALLWPPSLHEGSPDKGEKKPCWERESIIFYQAQECCPLSSGELPHHGGLQPLNSRIFQHVIVKNWFGLAKWWQWTDVKSFGHMPKRGIAGSYCNLFLVFNWFSLYFYSGCISLLFQRQ